MDFNLFISNRTYQFYVIHFSELMKLEQKIE